MKTKEIPFSPPHSKVHLHPPLIPFSRKSQASQRMSLLSEKAEANAPQVVSLT